MYLVDSKAFKFETSSATCLLGAIALEPSEILNLDLPVEKLESQLLIGLLQSLGLRNYKEAVCAAHMAFSSLPIIDMCAPEDPSRACAFVDEMAEYIRSGEKLLVHCRYGGFCTCVLPFALHLSLRLDETPPRSLCAADCSLLRYSELAILPHSSSSLHRKDHAAVRCRGGIGRAGMISACLLVSLGLANTAAEAIATVRKKRSAQAVQTERQSEFVKTYALSCLRRRSNGTLTEKAGRQGSSKDRRAKECEHERAGALKLAGSGAR